MPQLLVTNCTNGEEGGVYLLNTETGKNRRVLEGAARGITYGPDGIYVVQNKGEVYLLNPQTWKARFLRDTGFRASHDLRWIDDGFYLVASYGNLVARLDRSLQVTDRWQIIDSEEDICHANCVIPYDGDLLLSIFTLSAGRREDKRHGLPWRHEGKVLRLNWNDRRYDILHEPLSQPHSLTLHDGRFFCCESFTGQVSQVDLATGRKEVRRKLHGFVRGLAFAAGHAYVGISKPLHRTTLWEKLGLLGRMRCGVVELDPQSWQPRRWFRIPGTQVYEILPVADGQRLE